MINPYRPLSQQHLLPVSLGIPTGYLPLCLQNTERQMGSLQVHTTCITFRSPLTSYPGGFNNRAYRVQRKRHPHTIFVEYKLTHLHEKQLAISVYSHLMAIINSTNLRKDGNVDRDLCTRTVI